VTLPPLAGLLWMSGAVSIPAAVGAMALFAWVVMWAGFLLLRAVDAADMPAPAAWVLGMFATAAAIYALVAVFEVLAATAFVVWAALVVGCSFFSPRPEPGAQRMAWTEVLALALCGVVTVMWCHDIAEAPAILAAERLFPAWSDHFIHGGVISQFGDARAVDRGSIQMADFSKPLYHYASYVPPAVFAAPLDMPGLPLSTSVWLPLGFFTMCAGAYSLGTALGRPAGGIAAVAALTLLPDASNYGLRNGLFSFHWNALTHPGALYAIGVCLLAVALLQQAHRTGRRRPLATALGLAAGLALLRVHLFALAFPALLAGAAAVVRTRRRRIFLLGFAVLGFALFVVGFYAFTGYERALEVFVANVHTLHEPTAYQGWYQNLLESGGRRVAVPVGVLAVLLATLGALVVAYPAVLALTLRHRALRAGDSVTIAMVGCYILLMVTAPIPQHGDTTELTQRPSVLLYAVVVAWTAAALVEWIALRMPLGARGLWIAVLAASTLALPLVWPQTGALGLPKFGWGWRHLTHSVEDGLPEAARFLRRNFRPGDVFAAQGLSLEWAATDLATQVTSLTGAPAYLARPFVHISKGGRRQDVALERYAALTRVADEQSASAALARLRDMGVPWYVVAGSDGPRWDPQRRLAVFRHGKVAVYLSTSR
jgi:hypothetical protein